MRTLADWIVALGFVAVAVAVVLRLWLGPIIPERYRRRVEIAGLVVVVAFWGWVAGKALLHL